MSFLDPHFEYTLADVTVTAVGPFGRFPFMVMLDGTPRGLIEEFTNGSKEESKTVNGSGTKPRAHTRKLEKPSFEMTIPKDVATRFKKWTRGRVCTMIVTRQKPGSASITEVSYNWLPCFDTSAWKSGDATNVKVTGNCLDYKDDVKGVLA